MSTQSKLLALKRLVAVYGAVEEMHLVELQKLTRAIAEAEESIRVEQDSAYSARASSRIALSSDDRVGWRISDTQQGIATKRIGLLEQLREEHMLRQRAAMEEYVASRIRREQMNRLHDSSLRDRDAEYQRRAQATSDDRFLARRRWVDVRDKRRSPG